MGFPPGLTLVPVTGDVYGFPDGEVTEVLFVCRGWLDSPSEDAIVAPFSLPGTVNGGEITANVPATNKPGWTAFVYDVVLRYGNKTARGTMEVPHDAVSVDLADNLNFDQEAPVPGQTYIPLLQRGVPNGVASLDGSGDVPLSQLPALPLGQTTGLQAALDGKSPVGHGHAIADVTGLQASLDGKQAAGSYATSADLSTGLAGKADLVGGVVPTAQIPAVALVQYLGTAANQAAMLAKVGQPGDWVNRTDLGTSWQITGADPTLLANWTELLSPTSPVQSVAGKVGAVLLVKADVGLGSVNDTSDADKPISTAQAVVNAATFRATDHGLVGWSFDPVLQQGQFVLPTAGVSHVVRVRLLSSVVTGIRFHLVAPGSGLTANQCFASLHNAGGAQLGVGAITGDLSTVWNTGGDRLCPLNVAQGGLTPGDYLVRFWFNGTTGPSLSRAASSSPVAVNWGMSAPNFRYSTADTGLTTAASAPSNIGTQTGAGVALLVGLY